MRKGTQTLARCGHRHEDVPEGALVSHLKWTRKASLDSRRLEFANFAIAYMYIGVSFANVLRRSPRTPSRRSWRLSTAEHYVITTPSTIATATAGQHFPFAGHELPGNKYLYRQEHPRCYCHIYSRMYIMYFNNCKNFIAPLIFLVPASTWNLQPHHNICDV